MNPLRTLLAFLRLGAEGEGEGDQTDTTGSAVAEGEEEIGDLLEQVEPTQTGEEPPELVAERRKREQAEAELETERRRREVAEQSSQAQPRQPQPSSEYAREEQELADARAKMAAGQVTPEAVSWLEWRIKQERDNRASKEAAQRAEFRANDMADKSDFDRLELTKPKTYKKYAPRIEQALADARAKGQPTIPRMALLRYFIGDDMMNDKLQPAKPKAGATAPTKGVDRGRMPQARSDVNVKDRSGMTEHQKRIERMKAAHARGEYL